MSGYLYVVVEGLESAEVPAPALVGVTHEALVTHGVKGRVPGGDSDNGVSSSLTSRPADLQNKGCILSIYVEF